MKLPRSKKAARIAIAQDVIKHINSFKRVGETSYCSISFDALKQTKLSDKVKLGKGRWGEPTLKGGENVSVKDNFDDVVKCCEVCAKGAMSLGYVDIFNELDLQSLTIKDDEEMVVDELLKYFSQEQLDLIEMAFEQRLVLGYYVCDYPWADKMATREKVKFSKEDKEWDECDVSKIPTVNKALKFGARFKNDRNLLKAIMQNIIDNEGTFIP